MCGIVMAEVGILHEGSAPIACLLKGSKAFEVRSVLAGLEYAFQKRIVVADMRPDLQTLPGACRPPKRDALSMSMITYKEEGDALHRLVEVGHVQNHTLFGA